MRIQTVKPSRRRLAPQQAVENVGATLAGAGEMVQAVGQQFEKLRDYDHLLKAKNHADTQLTDLHIQATNEPDVWDVEKYTARAAEIKEESLQMIADPQARSQFGSQIEHTINVGRIRINRQMHDRQIEQSKADAFTQIDILSNKYAAELNPKIRQGHIAEMRATIANMVAIGAVDPVKAQEYIEKKVSSLESLRVDQDARSFGPEAALAGLKDGDYDLGPKEKAKKTEEVKKLLAKKIKADKERLEDLTDQNEITMVKRLFDPANLDPASFNEDLEKLEGVKGILPELSKALRKAAFSDKTPGAVTNGATFASLYERFGQIEVTEDNKPKTAKDRNELRQLMVDVVNAYGDGQLNVRDVSELVTLLDIPYQKMALGQRNNFWRKAGAVINSLNEASKFAWPNPAGLYQAGMRLFLQNPEAPAEDIVQKAVEHEQKATNPNRTLYEIGQVVEINTGSYKVVGYDTDGEPLVEVIQ